MSRFISIILLVSLRIVYLMSYKVPVLSSTRTSLAGLLLTNKRSRIQG